MTTMLEKTITELNKRRNQIAGQITTLKAESKKLDKAIKVLAKLSGGSTATATPRKRRKMSATARAKIRAAQKKRWAEWKKNKK